MDQPSWQQRAQEQAEGDRTAVEQFARDAERRQARNQLHNDSPFVDPFDDGRGGMPDEARGAVYFLHYRRRRHAGIGGGRLAAESYRAG